MSSQNSAKDSSISEDYKQQILFDEDELTANTLGVETQSQPIVVSNKDWQFDDATPDLLDRELAAESSRKPRWLWRTLAVLLVGIVGIEAFDFFVQGFVNSPITTGIYAAILGCVAALAGSSLIKELVGLRQLKRQIKMQERIVKLKAGEGQVNATKLCQQLTEQLPTDVSEERQMKWHAIEQQQYSDQELLELYSRVVLSEVDQKAVAEIAKYSSESVLLIALSPMAILDMLLIFWRNLKMLDKIAGLYGLKMGYWSRIKLIKQVFVNMVYAGASELVTDFGADMLGADVLGKLSGRLAQGLGAGLLTARLGLKALKVCRPIPFDNDQPKLGDIRQQMLTQIKAVTLKKQK